MKRAVSALAVAVLLAGCSTVGNVVKKTGQVLMDPSIPVGTPERLPSQVALSLYAGADVNPSRETASAAPTAADVSPPAEGAEGSASAPEPAVFRVTTDGPFVVNFRSPTRAALVTSLQSLLEHLDPPAARPVPLPLGSWKPSRPFRFDQTASTNDAPTLRPPLPFALMGPLGGEDARDVPLPVLPAGERGTAGQPLPRPLAQYGAGISVPDPAIASPVAHTATPIAFKVLQLKDDSLLLNADPQQLQKDPKKVLGSTLVAADDYLLLPGQFKFVNFEAIKGDTRYLAVLADFHDANPQATKQAFRLEPQGRKYALLITLQDTRVAITDETLPPQASPTLKPGRQP